MNTFIRNVAFMSMLLMAGCVSPHNEGRKYTFKEVGWTLTLPPEFKVADSAKTADMNQQGKKDMEESTNVKVDISTTKTLINAIKGLNNFNSSIVAFDPKTDGDFAVATRLTNNIAYKTLLDKVPDAKLDSSSGSVTIDGLQFNKFQIAITVKDQKFNMVILTKLYKGYDFGITYFYVDEATKRQIDGILASSQFQP